MECDRPDDQTGAAALWAEGQRRPQAIRELLRRHQGRLTTCDVSDVARELGVSEPPCIASSSSIGRLAAWTPCCPGAPVGAEEPASSPVKSRRPSVRRSKRFASQSLSRRSPMWSSRSTRDASNATCRCRTDGPSRPGWSRSLNANARKGDRPPNMFMASVHSHICGRAHHNPECGPGTYLEKKQCF